MTARVLMVQGTASDVGKSLVVAALCRVFARRGLRVLPFKAQNMALNAAVTPEGGEIGRAQATQAAAARATPHVDMNPILLKPEPGLVSQVIVLGRPLGRMRFDAYRERSEELEGVVQRSLARLRARADLVILEGAGSPVELNLKARELCNMRVAELADAPVILVGDIDRGGVFASLLGTLSLLTPSERARVKGLLVNKLRGDPALFAPGAALLAERAGVPVLGVLSHLGGLELPEEDSLGLEARRARGRAAHDELEIAVVRFPALSNYDDLLELEREPGVVVRYVDSARDLFGADLIVLPGTKSTLHDLAWMRARGMDRALRRIAESGGRVLGICGGAQMLGRSIEDPEGVEGPERAVERGAHAPRPIQAEGLGLAPLRTVFHREKRTSVTHVRALGGLFAPGLEAEGYEIHHGRTERLDGARPAFEVRSRNGEPTADHDGCVSESGAIVATMMHGVLRSRALRRSLLEALGFSPRGAIHHPDPYDALADAFEREVQVDRIEAIAGVRR
jgi:adenosylcobyric acid synthase